MSESAHFLPQYAAQAVIDLDKFGKAMEGRGAGHYPAYSRAMSKMLRSAVHVVLPPNGEIYRSNGIGGSMPTAAESESLYLPAPLTAFEYQWTYRPDEGSVADARKRITLVLDGRQTTRPEDVPADSVPGIIFYSIFFDERIGGWVCADTFVTVATPVEFHGKSNWWGARGTVTRTDTGERITDESLASRAISEYHADITAVVQCCHALRAGATFEERTESSATRRWKFEKRGVGGFTYHVLKLPEHAVRSSDACGGSHASPRLHVRRAHIRTLPTGALTFVRQCFVGDPSKGRVEKHYAVGAQRIAA